MAPHAEPDMDIHCGILKCINPDFNPEREAAFAAFFVSAIKVMDLISGIYCQCRSARSLPGNLYR